MGVCAGVSSTIGGIETTSSASLGLLPLLLLLLPSLSRKDKMVCGQIRKETLAAVAAAAAEAVVVVVAAVVEDGDGGCGCSGSGGSN